MDESLKAIAEKYFKKRCPICGHLNTPGISDDSDQVHYAYLGDWGIASSMIRFDYYCGKCGTIYNITAGNEKAINKYIKRQLEKGGKKHE